MFTKYKLLVYNRHGWTDRQTHAQPKNWIAHEDKKCSDFRFIEEWGKDNYCMTELQANKISSYSFFCWHLHKICDAFYTEQETKNSSYAAWQPKPRNR